MKYAYETWPVLPSVQKKKKKKKAFPISLVLFKRNILHNLLVCWERLHQLSVKNKK